MIPYSILGMKLIWPDESLDVRIIDPVYSGVLFRIAKNRRALFEQKPERVMLFFLDYRKGCYDSIEISDFLIEEEGEGYYTLKTENTDFTEMLDKAISDYSNYIKVKSEYDELESMEKMTGMNLETFPDSVDEWARQQQAEKIEAYRLSPVELAICLDEKILWDSFLSMEWQDFCQLYWELNHLQNHPISNQRVTHLYIGNQFCGHLFPDQLTLERLINRATDLGLVPVLVLSTMPEYMVEKYSKILDFAENVAKEKAVILEVVINDLGEAHIGKNKANLCFTLGILLNKRKKDSRLKYRAFDPQKATAVKSSIDLEEYSTYLEQRYNINAYSYESCGYTVEMRENAILHLPLYQMNTAGHCTMRALIDYGSRGKQCRNDKCDGRCAEKMLLYPSDAHMLGRWNTLFGCDMSLLNDGEQLNALINCGLKRLVVRF